MGKYASLEQLLHLARGKLTFARVAAKSGGETEPAARDPWGCMAGTVTIMPGTDLTAPSEVWNAEAGTS